MDGAVVVLNDLRPYGAQRVALALLEVWAQSGPRMTLVTLEDAEEGDLPVPPGVALVRLRRRGGRLRSLLSLSWQLHRTLAELRPTAVLSHMNFSNTILLLGVPASVRRRVPVVVVEHNILTKNLRMQKAGWASAALFRALHHRATRVVGVSDAVVDDLHASFRVPVERLTRVYNPVPHRARSGSRPAHAWLDDERKHVTLVCLAALRHAKGQDVLLEALGMLHDVDARPDDLRVVFLGDGPTRPALEAQVARLGLEDRVAFVGFRADAPEWLSASDAMVLPSRWDSFGLVVVEAARLGIPVIATAVPGLGEIVPRHVPGWVVAPESPEALTDLLKTLRRPVEAPPAPGGLDLFEPQPVARTYAELIAVSGPPRR